MATKILLLEGLASERYANDYGIDFGTIATIPFTIRMTRFIHATFLLAVDWEGLSEYVKENKINYRISYTGTPSDDGRVRAQYHIEFADDRQAVAFKLRWADRLG